MRFTVPALGVFATSLIGLGFASGELFPNISDNSHASPEVAQFFEGYFTAKSLHNASQWLDFFNPDQINYLDATLGLDLPNRSAWEAEVNALVPSWPPGSTSYPLFVLGDINSAVVHSEDTPGLFGAELRILSAFDFRDGTVIRAVDYWDGRKNPVIDGRAPLSQYPYDLAVSTVNETADPKMQEVADQLNTALSAGDVNATMALFSYDAVFEDWTLRTRQEGQLAIGRYLQRAVSRLPYGTHTTLRHVLGSAQGGGYEWRTNNRTVIDGITALELDDAGAITLLATVWDGSRMSDKNIKALSELALES
ncbi:hypothetical protein MMC10_006196 [Thelotrema lepadinum]|nr:hypothetical protein [Thelotrema lepadinum]